MLGGACRVSLMWPTAEQSSMPTVVPKRVLSLKLHWGKGIGGTL